MNLSLSLVQKIDKLRSEGLQVLQTNGLSIVSSNQSETFQACLSCELIVKSISKDLDNSIHVILSKNFMRNSHELCHSNDTVLLDFLINILFLELINNSFKDLLSYTLELCVKTSRLILKLQHEKSSNLKTLCDNL